MSELQKSEKLTDSKMSNLDDDENDLINDSQNIDDGEDDENESEEFFFNNHDLIGIEGIILAQKNEIE